MEVDHCGNATCGVGHRGGDRRVPGKYVLWREVILPSHVGVNAIDGLDRWTRNCCCVFGCSKSVHCCWSQIPVEFLQKEN